MHLSPEDDDAIMDGRAARRLPWWWSWVVPLGCLVWLLVAVCAVAVLL